MNQHSSYSHNPVIVKPTCTIKESTVLPLAPQYPWPTVSYLCSNGNDFQSYKSPAGVPVVYPYAAGLAENRPTALETTYWNKSYGTDVMEINFSHIKGQNYAKRSRKGSAAKNAKAVETVKKPSLKLQKDGHVFAQAVQTEKLNQNIGRNKEATQIHIPGNSTNPSLPSTSTGKEGVITSTKYSPVKPSTPEKSGPVKLAAGAKHILRPSESTDQDNARPIHSAIPFFEGTSTDTYASMQKTATVFWF